MLSLIFEWSFLRGSGAWDFRFGGLNLGLIRFRGCRIVGVREKTRAVGMLITSELTPRRSLHPSRPRHPKPAQDDEHWTFHAETRSSCRQRTLRQGVIPKVLHTSVQVPRRTTDPRERPHQLGYSKIHPHPHLCKFFFAKQQSYDPQNAVYVHKVLDDGYLLAENVSLPIYD